MSFGAAIELSRAEVFEKLDLDTERAARLHEAAVFEGADAAQDQGGVLGGAGVGFEEAARSLDHGLEHEHARENWKSGEMVLEIFLGGGDELEGRDALGCALEDVVNEVEVHGGG